MPPLTVDEQFKFLISCIRNSEGGKINFDKVKDECEIVSKGAAAKRYERLMKTHGIGSNGSAAANAEGSPAAEGTPAAEETTKKAKTPAKKATAKKATAKKRKLADDADDDVEESSPVKEEDED